jgi:phospholipase/carboxylesterase
MGPASVLPNRRGDRPQTTPWAPHIQTSQTAPPAMAAALSARVFALPDIEERPGVVADPRERALWLRDEVPKGPPDAFLGYREIGHFHPWDNSLHIALPPELVEAAVKAGWAEVHPVARAGHAPANMVMLYGPRDEAEADVLFGLIEAAVRRAGGRGAKDGRPRG